MMYHVGLGVNMFNLAALYCLIGIGVGTWYVIDQRQNESVGELVGSVMISFLFGGIVIVELLARYIYKKLARPVSAAAVKNRGKK